jgi:hypothetical protein
MADELAVDDRWLQREISHVDGDRQTHGEVAVAEQEQRVDKGRVHERHLQVSFRNPVVLLPQRGQQPICSV